MTFEVAGSEKHANAMSEGTKYTFEYNGKDVSLTCHLKDLARGSVTPYAIDVILPYEQGRICKLKLRRHVDSAAM